LARRSGGEGDALIDVITSGAPGGLDESATIGKRERRTVPRSAHADWSPHPDRDPIGLLQRQAAARDPELIPIRHRRMAASSFAYFRGAAYQMAWDLSTTPTTSLTAQLCGDAHLANFGLYGTPERHLNFDLNDFDETHPGPFEWDVKRLAASIEVAGRDRGSSARERRDATLAAVSSYRESMLAFAVKPSIEVWYAHLDADQLLPTFADALDPVETPTLWRAIERARVHDSVQAFEKLTSIVDGEPRIVHEPPLIMPIEDVVGIDRRRLLETLRSMMVSYRRTLGAETGFLISRYRIVDVARKVVGVGSVGTQCWIVLLIDRRFGTPLMIQVKEAQPSVLEAFLKKGPFRHQGHRVVAGQRLMQAASDIFLGWERTEWSGRWQDYYVRQLRDWKGSAEVTRMSAKGITLYARMCGWTLARAHARSGDPVAMAGYLGRSGTFDQALVAFASAYADQNELDLAEMRRAMDDGRLAG
jgi:uncharacterized protein (DUF2252 family)